ncbi:MAG: lamin tail domain-containing protein [Phycisphaerae bacterium]|nr:lamin tail domain-containing protein [Phycisphaerae bacterium]
MKDVWQNSGSGLVAPSRIVRFNETPDSCGCSCRGKSTHKLVFSKNSLERRSTHKLVFSKNSLEGATRKFHRGSVLVMVVGLLTMIAMLGATFLLISHMERRTAEALAKQTPADPVAQGLVSQIQAKLREDLYIDATGVYHAATTVEEYTDYPSDGIDSWLASTENTTGTGTVLVGHITNDLIEDFDLLDGTPNNHVETTNVTFTKTGDQWNLFHNRRPVDTDGDDYADALLSPTGVTNAAGQEYHAAVRVIDLSALINVNTAGTDTGTLPAFTSPVHVELQQFLVDKLNAPPGAGGPCWTALNTTRGSDPADLETYYNQCASQLYSPTATTYLPFAIGDEVYLRWGLGNVSSPPPFQIGRLFDALTYQTSFRQNLTTFNCTRNLLRRANATLTKRIPLRETTNGTIDFMALSDTDPDGANKRNGLYTILAEALGNTDAARITAAHFVANLWAYMDGQDPDKAYEFEVTGHSAAPDPKVYGVVPQPFIVEAYAYNLQDSPLTPPPEDHGWAFAIELYNPSTNPITLGGKYKLVQGANEEIFPGSVSISAGGRYTIYTFGGKFDPGTGLRGDAAEADFGFDTIGSSEKHRWDSLDFVSGDPVRLVRIPLGNDPGDPKIEIDSVSKSDFGYVTNDVINDDTFVANGRRDDDTGTTISPDTRRHRYALQAMAKWRDGVPVGTTAPVGAAVKNHTLGSPNGDYYSWPALPAGNQQNEVSFSTYYGGFSILKSKNGATDVREMNSLTDVMKIFLVGAIDDGDKSLAEQLTSKANDSSRAYANELSTTQTGTGTSYPANVPFGVILGEICDVLPADTTRGDDTRVYGKVNINTATKETLLRLPWPDDVNGEDLTKAAAPNKEAIVDDIIDKRDNTYSGFKTPGQLATVLGDYFDANLNTPTTLDDSDADYLEERGKLYSAVANLVTVNSDTYAVYIYVQIPDGDDVDSLPEYEARYLGVIDRSNCRETGQQPAVLLFTPIK